jgi:heme O synthase-like polyprenyltransferase
MANRAYFYGALALGVFFTGAAVMAAVKRTDAAARALFLASILYLASLLALLLITRT